MEIEKPNNVTHMSQYSDELDKSSIRELEALEAFFTTHVADFDAKGQWSIKKYHGFVGKTEVIYVRIDYAGGSKTVVIENTRFKDFVAACADKNWAFMHTENRNDEMKQKGFVNTVTIYRVKVADNVYIELPLEALQGGGSSELDKFTNGDFITFERQVQALRDHVNFSVAEATRLSQKLGLLTKKKDHDLYLSFKGVEGYSAISISLDRVYPLLPESGELEINTPGSNCLDSWKEYDPIIFKNVRQIVAFSKSINKKIVQLGELVNSDPFFKDRWNEEVKVQLLAASHYMRKIYTFQAMDGKQLIEDVTNDIIRKLTNHGGNIGLDLNEWIVWSYPEDGSAPVKVTDPELNFYESIFHRYTESFTEALYGHLLGVSNPYIKPYQFREVVTVDDGIVEGTMRRV